MATTLSPEESLRAGDLTAALKSLQEQVRARPGDSKLRVFLFQLLCILGQWDRAASQLETAASLDPGALPMKQTYTEAIKCELVRAQVFAGKISPMVFGEPDPWVALLIQSLLHGGDGDSAQAQALREQAFEQAPETAGTLDDKPFAWIADADMRLGPLLEVVINGKYGWVPFSRVSRLTMEAPTDLRDCVWMPAHLQFEGGGEVPALIPTRYPGSEASDDPMIRLARKTTWDQVRPDVYLGTGQRLMTTDAGEFPLMDIRTIATGSAQVGEPVQ